MRSNERLGNLTESRKEQNANLFRVTAQITIYRSTELLVTIKRLNKNTLNAFDYQTLSQRFSASGTRAGSQHVRLESFWLYGSM